MLFENSLIFHPDPHPSGNWRPAGLAFEDVFFESEDGTALHGWYVRHPTPKAHVLFSHGNAGNITHRADLVRLLRDECQVSVLVYDYRGYGRSEGKPNEHGVIADGRAARQRLGELAGIESVEVVLLGRSLGGAVAVALAAERAPRALVLESTFSSMPEVARHHFPFVPTKMLMRTRLNSEEKIRDYKGPLLQSHGTRDEVIPYEIGKKLYAAAPAGKKEFFEIPGGRHNDMPPKAYRARLKSFLANLPE
jgi:fermentation-respiration switch protein FrsA (DUF1100 family)